MTAYEVALFIHILGAITLFGALTILQRGGGQLRQAATVDHLRLWLSLLRATRQMFPVAAVFLFASGLFMTNEVWSFTTPWVLVAIVALSAMVVLGATVVGRGLARIGTAAMGAEEGPVPHDLKRMVRAPATWMVSSANNGAGIGVVWLMTTKPDWAGSISIVVGLSILGAIIGNLVTRRSNP
jgi:hypothetical protein